MNIRSITPCNRTIPVIALIPLLIGACAPTFHCTESMTGAGCNSVSQVYKDTHQGKKTSEVYDASHPKNTPIVKATPPRGLPQTIKPGDPLRSGERVLRVWMSPWVDSDRDYHEQSYVYLVLNHGRWYVDQARQRIMKQYAPLHVTPPAVVSNKQTNRGPTYDAQITNRQDANEAGKPAPGTPPTLDAQILK